MAAQPESHMTPERRAHLLARSQPSSSPPGPPSSHRFATPSSSLSTTMAAVASSSKPSPSRNAGRPRSSLFKPKFPLDPFAGASAAALGEPWFLKIDALLAATAFQRRNVIFVLGAPSLNDLAPLLQSRHMAKSLVILATHKPPDIPGIVIPAVRVLRLSSPLALEDSGAVRFVNVLEWAERVARTWRKHGGGGVIDLSEDTDSNGELAPPPMSRFGSQSTPTSPGSSSTHLSAESGQSSRPSSFAASLFTRRGHVSLPPPDPTQRPFDVLVNFMPDKVSDKALLKNSILVTTISRPFLTSSAHPSPPTLRSRTGSSSSTRLRPSSLFGAFSRSTTSVYMPPTPPYQSGESLAQMLPAPPGKALLIHLLPVPQPNAPPAARRKLVESMESFLLSFAFQSAGSSLPPFPGSGLGGPLDRARPYVMYATTFRDSVGCEPGVADYGDFTVADVVLSGALDADTPSASAVRGMPPVMTTSLSVGTMPKPPKSSRRAWIAAAADLVIMPSSDDSSLPAPLDASQMPSTWTEPTLAPIQQGRVGPFDSKVRSTSAPILSELAPPVGGSRRASHSHLAPPSSGLARESKSAYSLSSSVQTSPSMGSPGLPTPPHSEESEEGGGGAGECVSLDADADGSYAASRSTSSDRDKSEGHGISIGHGDGREGESGRKKSKKWQFWRRMGGHHAHPTAVKA